MLEHIAAGVRAFADDADGPIAAVRHFESSLARLADSTHRLAGPEANQMRGAIDDATRSARASAAAIETFRQDANAFADRLVGGGGGGGISDQSSSGNEAAKKSTPIEEIGYGQKWGPLSSFPELHSAVDRLISSADKSVAAWDDQAQRSAKRWFGSDSNSTRDQLVARIDRLKAALPRVALFRFEPQMATESSTFAYVYGSDTGELRVFVDTLFAATSDSPPDSRAGVILHELSHFTTVSGTDDHEYGHGNCQNLALVSASDAWANADNFEYFMEEYT